MRSRLVVSLAVVASALAAPAAGSDGGPSPGALVGWTGVLSPIGTIRYAALATGRSTLVAAVEVEGGRVLDYRTIRGRYGIPLVADDGTTGGVSGDGSALVLAPLAAPSAPDGTTRFVVLLPGQRLLPWRTIALRGAFSFDAISPSGRFLYLVEYLPSPSGYATYRVRAYDVRRGELLAGAIVDRRQQGEAMEGSPVTRASSRDGRWAYTLYARPRGHPFVHALDTTGRRAFCVDLPWRGYAPEALNGVKLVVSERALVLRDYAGRLASIDRKTFGVRSTREP